MVFRASVAVGGPPAAMFLALTAILEYHVCWCIVCTFRLSQSARVRFEEDWMNIYVGNLSRDMSEGELRQAFEQHGTVASVRIITDKMSGEPRGFGFVEMPTQAEAEAAIAALNGNNLKGRTLTVNEARPPAEGGRRTGGGGGGHRSPGGGGSGSGRRPW